MTKSVKKQTAPVRSKNWLVTKFREWHTWGGLFAAIFLLVAGATGIILNYEKPILRFVGLDPGFPQPDKMAGDASLKADSTGFNTQTGFQAAPVTSDRAFRIARAELGDVALERVELKNDHGELIWKVKSMGGDEVWINAISGSHFMKAEYEKLGPKTATGQPEKSFDWGKLFLNLHTGKIGGEIGKALMTVASGILLFLSLSGVYLWAKPVLIRRNNSKAKAAAASVLVSAAVPRHPPTPATASQTTIIVS